MIFIIRTAAKVVSTGMMILYNILYCVTRSYIVITILCRSMRWKYCIPVFHLCSAAEWAEPSDESPRQPIILRACCTVDYYLGTIMKKSYVPIYYTYICYMYVSTCSTSSYDFFSFFSSYFHLKNVSSQCVRSYICICICMYDSRKSYFKSDSNTLF